MPIDITVCDRVKRRLDEVMLVGDEPRADQLATTIRTLLFGRAPEGRRLADSCHLEHSAASVQHWDGHSLTVGDCWVPDGSDEQWQHTMDDSGRFTMVERVLMDAFVGIPMRDDGYRDATGSLLQHLTRPHCVAGCIRPEHLIYRERENGGLPAVYMLRPGTYAHCRHITWLKDKTERIWRVMPRGGGYLGVYDSLLGAQERAYDYTLCTATGAPQIVDYTVRVTRDGDDSCGDLQTLSYGGEE